MAHVPELSQPSTAPTLAQKSCKPKSTGLSGMDRLLGLVFGSFRGAIVVIVILVAVEPFATEHAWWRQSKLRPALMAFEQDVVSLVSVMSSQVQTLREEIKVD